MPGLIFAPKYHQPLPTNESLEWADLAVLDFAKAGTVSGIAELVQQARDAMKEVGFFYIINHGYTPDETSRIFDVADVPFSCVSQTEKDKYAGRMKLSGSYQGYKPRSYWHIDNGVRDQNEHYNVNRDVTKKEHPEALRPFLSEISSFAHFNHFRVLHVILKLLAIGLELPEDAFVNIHNYDSIGESYVRFMKYYPRSEDEERKTKNVWLKGHTDFGSITLLWSQPVSALQILTPGGEWRWVRHIENALVVNAGDCMEFLSGGFYKATIHRVVQPPVDQQSHERLGVFYFAMPDDNVRLTPMVNSPVLEREGFVNRFQEGEAPNVEAWRKARTSAYGQSILKRGDNGDEEEEINGVIVKHFN